MADKWPISTVTASTPNAFPSTLREKRSKIQTINDDEIETLATVSKTCPTCENQTLLWRDMQLRGADEGMTIFYWCPDCNYRSVWRDIKRAVPIMNLGRRRTINTARSHCAARKPWRFRAYPLDA